MYLQIDISIGKYAVEPLALLFYYTPLKRNSKGFKRLSFVKK